MITFIKKDQIFGPSATLRNTWVGVTNDNLKTIEGFKIDAKYELLKWSVF